MWLPGLWLRTWLVAAADEGGKRRGWEGRDGGCATKACASVGANAALFCIPRTPFPGNTKPNCRTCPPRKRPTKTTKSAPKPAERTNDLNSACKRWSAELVNAKRDGPESVRSRPQGTRLLTLWRLACRTQQAASDMIRQPRLAALCSQANAQPSARPSAMALPLGQHKSSATARSRSRKQ